MISLASREEPGMVASGLFIALSPQPNGCREEHISIFGVAIRKRKAS